MERCAYFSEKSTERVPNTLSDNGQVFSIQPDIWLPKLHNNKFFNKFFKPMTE